MKIRIGSARIAAVIPATPSPAFRIARKLFSQVRLHWDSMLGVRAARCDRGADYPVGHG